MPEVSLVQPSLESVPESVRGHFKQVKPIQSITEVKDQISSAMIVLDEIAKVDYQSEVKEYIKSYLSHYIALLNQFNNKLDEATPLITATREALTTADFLPAVTENLNKLAELHDAFKAFQKQGKNFAGFYEKVKSYSDDVISEADLQILKELNDSKIFDVKNTNPNKYLQVANDIIKISHECQAKIIGNNKPAGYDKESMQKYAASVINNKEEVTNINFFAELLADKEAKQILLNHTDINLLFQKIETGNIFKRALDLTSMSAKLFKAIPTEEFLNPKFYNNPDICKNLIAYNRNAEQLTAYVKSSILANQNLIGCALAIQSWIEIAYLCYKFGNFKDSMTILAVINNNSAIRNFLYENEALSKLYLTLPTQTRKHFEELKAGLKESKQIEEQQGMQIPHLSFYTGRLMRIEEVEGSNFRDSKVVKQVIATLEDMQNGIPDNIIERNSMNSLEPLFALAQLESINTGRNFDDIQKKIANDILTSENQELPLKSVASNFIDFDNLDELLKTQSKFLVRKNVATVVKPKVNEAIGQETAPLFIAAFGTWETKETVCFAKAFMEACSLPDTKKITLDGINLAGTNVNEKVLTVLEQIKQYFLTNIKLGLPVPKTIVGLGFSRGSIALFRIAHGITDILIPQLLIEHNALTGSNKEDYRKLIEALSDAEFSIFAGDAVAGLANKNDDAARIIPSNVKECVATYQTAEERAIMKGKGPTRTVLADPTKTSITFLPISGRHVDGTRITAKNPNNTKAEAAKINWILAYDFLKKHGVSFVDDKIPAIAVKAPVEGKPKKFATTFVDMSNELNEIKNEPAKLLELYAELKNNNNYGERSKNRFGHENPENFVLDSNVFMNQHERELFKLAYPELFNFAFENNFNAVTVDLVKAQLDLMQTEYPKTFLNFIRTRATLQSKLVDSSVVAVRFQYEDLALALTVGGKRQKENFKFLNALPAVYSPLTLMTHLVRENMYQYIRTRSEIMHNADHDQAKFILQKLDKILSAGGDAKYKLGKISDLLTDVKTAIDQEKQNGNFIRKVKDTMSKQDLSQYIQDVFNKYEKYLEKLPQNFAELDEGSFDAVAVSDETEDTQLLREQLKQPSVLQLISSLNPEMKISEDQRKAIINIIRELSDKSFESTIVSAETVSKYINDEIADYLNNSNLSQLNSEQLKVIHLAIVRNQLNIDKKWKAMWQNFAEILSKVDAALQSELKQHFELIKTQLSPDNIYSLVYSSEFRQEIAEAKTQERLNYCFKSKLEPISEAVKSLKNIKKILEEADSVKNYHYNEFKNYTNHITNWVAQNQLVIWPLLQAKNNEILANGTGDTEMQAKHFVNHKQIQNKLVFELLSHPERTNAYITNNNLVQKLNQLLWQSDINSANETQVLASIFVELGLPLSVDQLDKIQAHNSIIREILKTIDNEELTYLITDKPDLMRVIDSLPSNVYEIINGESPDVSQLDNSLKMLSASELERLKLASLTSYFTKAVGKLEQSIDKMDLKNANKVEKAAEKLYKLNEEYEKYYLSQQFLEMPPDKLATLNAYAEILNEIPQRLAKLDNTVESKLPHRRKLLEINALINSPDAAAVLHNNVADIQIPDSLSNVQIEEFAASFNKLIKDPLINLEKISDLFKQADLIVTDEACQKIIDYAIKSQKASELASLILEKIQSIDITSLKKGQAFYRSLSSSETTGEDVKQLNTFIHAVINLFNDIIGSCANYTAGCEAIYASVKDNNSLSMATDDLLPMQINYMLDQIISKTTYDKIRLLDEIIFELDPGLLNGQNGYYFSSVLMASTSYLYTFDKPINDYASLEVSVNNLASAIEKFEKSANLSADEQQHILSTIQKIQRDEVLNYTANIAELEKLLQQAQINKTKVGSKEQSLYKSRLDKLNEIETKLPKLKATIKYYNERLIRLNDILYPKASDTILNMSIASAENDEKIESTQSAKTKFGSNLKAKLERLLQAIVSISDKPLRLFETLLKKHPEKNDQNFAQVKSEVLVEHGLQKSAEQQIQLKQKVDNLALKNALLHEAHITLDESTIIAINKLAQQENLRVNQLNRKLQEISGIQLSEKQAKAVVETACLTWLDNNMNVIKDKYNVNTLPGTIQEMAEFAKKSAKARSPLARLKMSRAQAVMSVGMFLNNIDMTLGDLKFLKSILKMVNTLNYEELLKRFPQWANKESNELLTTMLDTLKKIIHEAKYAQAYLDHKETQLAFKTQKIKTLHDEKSQAPKLSDEMSINLDDIVSKQITLRATPVMNAGAFQGQANIDHGDSARHEIAKRILNRDYSHGFIKPNSLPTAELKNEEIIFKKNNKQLGFKVTQDGTFHFYKDKNNEIVDAKDGSKVYASLGVDAYIDCTNKEDADVMALKLRTYNPAIKVFYRCSKAESYNLVEAPKKSFVSALFTTVEDKLMKSRKEPALAAPVEQKESLINFIAQRLR